MQPKPRSTASGEAKERFGEVSTPNNPSHTLRRMQAFRAGGEQLSKKDRIKRWRIDKAISRTMCVPFEFNDLRTSYTTQAESRVYPHEELEALGIRTVKWDGV